jgi:ABC-2 type transport system ATP-binding protein
MKRIEAHFMADPETEGVHSGGTLQSREPLIRTVDLSKRYGRTVALDNVSVEIPRSAVGLLGPNGAGKTTLLRLLLGLAEPTSGHLEVFGSDVKRNTFEIRRRIGYMPESDCLATDVSAFDFVRHMAETSGLPSKEARLRTAEMLFLCGLNEERYRMIREFSTGMKQRVKLAQALVHDPDLIFLDEPTNGLDPAGHDEMLTLISRIHTELDIAVVLSSHVLEDVERVCDFVMMIDAGRLIGSGYLSHLMETRQEISLEVDGDSTAFIDALNARGVTADSQNGVLSIAYEDDDVFDVIRDAAVESETALRSLRTRRTSLEEFYIDLIESANADSGEQG